MYKKVLFLTIFNNLWVSANGMCLPKSPMGQGFDKVYAIVEKLTA